MSKDVIEIQEIRREKENIQTLISRYLKRSEELKAKEEVLIKKMGDMKSKEFNWKQAMEDTQHSGGYVICDSIYRILNIAETPEMKKDKIIKLREEVLQKQLENMKLEKELENRKEEHRIFHEMLLKRKEALGGGCLESECSTSFKEGGGFAGERLKSGGSNKSDGNKVSDNKFGNEAWEDARNSLD